MKKLLYLVSLINIVSVFLSFNCFCAVLIWGTNTINNEKPIIQLWEDTRTDEEIANKDKPIKGDSKEEAILKYKQKTENK